MQMPTGSERPDSLILCIYYGKTILDRCERKESGKRPLNVVIVGTKGSGKSSFINSLAASLSHERWIEYSTAGTCSGNRPVTSYICKFKQCCNEEASFYENVLLPTLTDTPGLMEVAADDSQTLKFLRLLFYGHIQNHADALQVYADCKRDWNDLLWTYPRQYDGTRADRVIFVASAAEDLPHRLMECVLKAARPPTQPRGYQAPNTCVRRVDTH